MLQVFLTACRAIPLSLGIAFSAVGIGILLGTPVALLRFYRVPLMEPLFRVIVTIIRGIPGILLFLVFYLVLSAATRFSRSAIAIIAMALPAIIRVSELVRGSLESIPKSQFDAAYSVGHTGRAVFFRIIVPQMIPVCIPLLGNVVILNLKTVPVASVIGVMDILNTALVEATVNYRYLEAYFTAGIVFWGLFIVVERLFALIENHFKKQFRGPAVL
jgi:L-cystine transport system permease protein